MHYGATSQIFERARELRAKMTQAEKLLWQRLSKNQLGCKFRRQHPISFFILDFYSHEYRLAVEVDGKIHDGENQQFLDSERTRNLEELGVKVIRFTNEQVIYHIEDVITEIKHQLSQS